MTYKVEISKKAKKELDRLPLAAQESLLSKIEALADNPHPPGSKSIVGKNNMYRIRDGIYRAVYTIHDDIVLVYVVRVEHRKEAYRRL